MLYCRVSIKVAIRDTAVLDALRIAMYDLNTTSHMRCWWVVLL